MQTYWYFNHLCSIISYYWIICRNYPNFGALGQNLGYFCTGPKCSTGLFWKPQPCALRKTPAAIPHGLGYAYSQLLVYETGRNYFLSFAIAVVLGGTTVLPWNRGWYRGTSFSRYHTVEVTVLPWYRYSSSSSSSSSSMIVRRSDHSRVSRWWGVCTPLQGVWRSCVWNAVTVSALTQALGREFHSGIVLTKNECLY